MPSKDEKNQNFNLDSSSLLNDKEIRSEFKFKDDWIPDKAKKGYHEQRLSQSKWAFRLSFWGSIIGFLVIVQGIRNSTGLNNVEWAGIISGTVIEAVSALFYGLSNKANEKITEFFVELTKDSNIKSAISLLVKLSLHLSGISEEKICKDFTEVCNKNKDDT